jgi:crotonobetainyl-CoA:carnitine CoA-transferase CaiB-like acyl-CoA transferase
MREVVSIDADEGFKRLCDALIQGLPELNKDPRLLYDVGRAIQHTNGVVSHSQAWHSAHNALAYSVRNLRDVVGERVWKVTAKITEYFDD